MCWGMQHKVAAKVPHLDTTWNNEKSAHVHVKFTREDLLLLIMIRQGQDHIQQKPQESHGDLHKGARWLTAKQTPKQ